ncbi:hypothetical protein FAUST_1268 [Fusarium austroamericanum]|uniref:L-asparaginase N-terminal domain-containing protein n=1 Tax=Fusarium austroamericanum TaxID=282268 RepID=A0AAN6HK19_FUSAU|nr:hypothetical protein FAUST_1268 [Fusarium austroamericanum]
MSRVYNTGDGTILSCSTNGRPDTTNYGGPVGRLTPETLIESVSEVLDIAQIAIVNFTGGIDGASSANAGSDRFLNISMDAHKRLCSPDSDIVGAIMIHGTNTLADTVFGVDLTLNCSKPFVTTGSMRPNSALSADGPSNFYDAVRTAIHPEARDRGALIAMNDHLVSAFYATKTNEGFDADLLYSAAKNGAKGIVIMGVGPGALSMAAFEAAEDLYSQGVITVASFRPISSGVLRGEKALIQLQLVLGAGYDFKGIQKLFEGEVRKAVYNDATAFFNGTVL